MNKPPSGYFASLLAATFDIMLQVGYASAGDYEHVDYSEPDCVADHPPPPEGYRYVCTYHVIDDISGCSIHVYVCDATRDRLYFGAPLPYFEDVPCPIAEYVKATGQLPG